MALFHLHFRVHVHLLVVVVVGVRVQGCRGVRRTYWQSPMQSVCEDEEVQAHCKQHKVDPDTLKAEGVQVGCCVFSSESECTARHKPKQWIFQSTPGQSSNQTPHIWRTCVVSKEQNTMCFSCYFHPQTDLDEARPCVQWCLTPDQEP